MSWGAKYYYCCLELGLTSCLKSQAYVHDSRMDILTLANKICNRFVPLSYCGRPFIQVEELSLLFIE